MHTEKKKQAVLRIVAATLLCMAVMAAIHQTMQVNRVTAQGLMWREQTEMLLIENARLQQSVPVAALRDGEHASFAYQAMYEDMYVESVQAFIPAEGKTAYLTFDDGPSRKNTEAILNALRDAGAKATFFVVGKNIAGNEDLLQRMVNEGHAIGVHTFTHDYKQIYASPEAFLEDFYQTYNAVYAACGVYPEIFRFPGGSINSYNGVFYQQIIAEMLRRGFIYYDWNVSSQDAAGKEYSSAEIADFVVNGSIGLSAPIVLMHDSGAKGATAGAVPAMISRLKEAGYTFKALDQTVEPVSFGYRKME